MANGLNKVLLIGNVGVPPDLRYTQSGQAVLSLRMATNERMKIQGEWKDKAEWHNVVVWGKRAEGLNKVLEKGTHMFVEGRLQTREWMDKDHNKRYTTEIVAREVILLGKKGGGRRDDAPPPDDSNYYDGYSGSDYQGGGGNYVDNNGGGYGGGGGSELSEDDIPF